MPHFISMQKNYASEDKRIDAFLESILPLLELTKSGTFSTGSYQFRKNIGPDAFVEVPVNNSEGRKALTCIFEGNHEIESCNDPVVQSNLDYSKYAGEMASQKNIGGALPCLIVTLSGTLLTVHLGIVEKYVTISRLFDGFQFQDCQAFRRGAQLLIALQTSLNILNSCFIT